MLLSRRRCSTCRFYEPAPIWRKGWCRNPQLFPEGANHLVEGHLIDCAKPFQLFRTDHWEAGVHPVAREAAPADVVWNGEAASIDSPSLADDGSEPEVRPRRAVRGPLLQRVALPACAGMVLATLVFFGSRAVLGREADAGPLPTPPAPLVVAVPTPVPSPEPTPPPLVLEAGGTAEVTGTGSDGLALRRGPGRNQPVIRVLRDGARLSVQGGPQESDGHQWWQVAAAESGDAGWTAQDWLAPVAQ